MPELPEVEIVVRGLKKKIVGRKITAVSFDWPRKVFLGGQTLERQPRLQKEFIKQLVSSQIAEINRHGKIIQISLKPEAHLLVHLKLTGQLIFINKKEHWAAGHPNDDFFGKMPSKATRLTIKFTDGSHLYFNDQRKFGWVKLVSDEEPRKEGTIQKLGPDALNRKFSAEYLKEKLGVRKIKQIILDQSIVSGIGNIYADESLFASRIHPSRKGVLLKEAEIKKLVENIKKVMRLSIQLGGTSLRNYVNSDGQKGTMKEHLKMYGRKGEKCLVCKNTIQRTTVGGRGTYFCGKCQR